MLAEVLSVNVSGLQKMFGNGQEILTGIYKQSVDHAVSVQTLGIIGDSQADLVNHGGRDKAVYFYPAEHFPFWAAILGLPLLKPGALGENFTVRGILETEAFIGDVWRIGPLLFRSFSHAARATS
jgi:MOSC domain-containing protein YiiM